MRIKGYLNFINESRVSEIEQECSIGEWVMSKIEENEDVLRIVNNYLKDIKPDIELLNAVNLLSTWDKDTLVKEIEDTLSGNQEGELAVTATVVNENFTEEVESIAIGGKNTFNCFLYSLTSIGALGEPKWDFCPDNYYIYWSHEADKEDLIDVLSRYHSLHSGIKQLEKCKSKCGLFMGISMSDNLIYVDYGVVVDGDRVLIGQFKLTNSLMFNIMSKPNKSLNSFKKEMKDVTLNTIKTLMVAKKELLKFTPGDYEKKSNIIVKDGIMSFGIYGIGKWDGKNLDDSDFESLKNKFKSWLSKYRWSEKIVVSVKPADYWVYFSIKVK